MTDPAPTPTLPASAYLDEAVWEAEVEQVFRTGWVPVCRVDQIPRSGDRYATVDRRAPGRRRARRRGGPGPHQRLPAPLVDRRRARLQPRPQPGLPLPPLVLRARRARCRPRRWPGRSRSTASPCPSSATRSGSASSWSTSTARPSRWPRSSRAWPRSSLRGTSTSWSRSPAGRIPSAWNWKVMVENWIECYHHIGSHRNTVEARNPARTTHITETDAPWTFMTVDTDARGRLAARPARLPDGPGRRRSPHDLGRLPLPARRDRSQLLVLAGADPAHRRPPPRHVAPADLAGERRGLGPRT